MCNKELLEKMKTKGSLINIQSYVEEIMKEKYKNNLLNEEIYTLFEKITDLAKDVYDEDKPSQEFDVTSIISVLHSLCKKLEITKLERIENWVYPDYLL